MEGNTLQQPNGSLEDQLRNMILTNVGVAGQHPLPIPAAAAPPAFSEGPAPGHSAQRHFPHHNPRHFHQNANQMPGRGFHNHHHQKHHDHHQHPRHGSNPSFQPQGFMSHEHRGGHSHFAPRGGFSGRGMHHVQPGHFPPQNGIQVDPNNFHRGPSFGMQARQPRQLYHPQHQSFALPQGPQFELQWQYLEGLVSQEIPLVEMSTEEVASKDSFRVYLENICRSLESKYPDYDLPSVTLQCFGSLSSGFASAGSDMDLVIVTENNNSTEQPHLSLQERGLPRVLEKELLTQGVGARLLTRTRVPIIKICESPTPELLDALKKERQRWEALPDDEKYSSSAAPQHEQGPSASTAATLPVIETPGSAEPGMQPGPHQADSIQVESSSQAIDAEQDSAAKSTETKLPQPSEGHAAKQHNNNNRKWTRERVAGPLDFPKHGVGIQCDINFFNPLGLFNTKLLRCYSKCDPRVRPMVLFVKAWAKRRKINSSYSGTLSSYGYVLMVLHYLVNVARPPVLPNLQLQAARMGLPASSVDGWEVRFYGDEEEIVNSASRGQLTQNNDPLGMLLRGFFQYYSSTSGGQGFIWMQDVLSLRTPGGLLKKEEKGWTGAKTEVGDNHKEVRHRYLFAIEDPFELTHNVARTVTHNGIVAIRDEFRRAWRIIQTIGRGLVPHDGELFAELADDATVVTHPRPKPEVAQVAQPTQAGPLTQSAESATSEDYAQAFPQLGSPASTSAKPHNDRSPKVTLPGGAPSHRQQNGNHRSSTQRNKSSGAVVFDAKQTITHTPSSKK